MKTLTAFDDLPPDDPEWYSAAEYRRALLSLSPPLSERQRRMLIAHALAPDLILTVNQLAAAAGYSQPNVTYAQYGRLGHAIAVALDHAAEEVVWTRLIGRDTRVNGDLIWEMEPALARALVSLGWVTRPGSSDTLIEIDAARLELASLPETERQALILARIGQGQFRLALMRLHGGCMLSGVTEPAALRASHIKPWRLSTNEERLEAANGLLLCAHYDALFDAGLLSFNDDGQILVSGDLAPGDCTRLGLTGAEQLSTVCDRMRPFLAYHRSEVFRHH